MSSSAITIRSDPSLFSASDRRDYAERKNELKRKYERDLRNLERRYKPFIHVSLAEHIADDIEAVLERERQAGGSQVIPSEEKKRERIRIQSVQSEPEEIWPKIMPTKAVA